ncbi:TPA: restriction endonuclease subunit S [Enterobacter cloacae]|nr:restriction endonuclease subunit S [Enterobacter cloacae]
MSKEPKIYKLDAWIKQGALSLGRGNIISKVDIKKDQGSYPIYSSSAHNNGKFGEYGHYMFDEELVTWSVDGGGSFFYRPKHKFSVTNVCGYMRVNGDFFDTSYVYYCLAHQHESLTFDYTTKAHPSVIRNLYWLPSIDMTIQKKISKILRTCDEVIDKTSSLVKKYKEIKVGILGDLFYRGVDSDGEIRLKYEVSPGLYKKESFGWIPKEWDVVSFGNVISVIDPNPSHRYPPDSENGYPICSTENFYGDDDFDFKKSKLVSENVFNSQNNRCNFAPTDVVFARKGRIGLARRYGLQKKAFSHTVVIMKPLDHRVDENWLLWLTRSSCFLNSIEKEMNTNLGVPTLGVDFIKGISIPIPKIEEQIKINGVLDKLAEKINLLEQELIKLRYKKQGLMHDLLTGKISMQLKDKGVHHV